ncbi:MAG: hypothetical protein PHT79_10975 [Syntrophomonadaceae bacterium]|nr:hypothetical protein [Syntrophomonadaceae bacterium]MDD3889445.1 hypothetical protein [Syntrophomonadaceae bacterium]MDD4550267.1 hypothetical protein [Syntrophomonadaceae bacterium]
MKELKEIGIHLASEEYYHFISQKRKLDNILLHSGINNIPADPEPGKFKIGAYVNYKFRIDINTHEYEWLIKKLNQIKIEYSNRYVFQFSPKEIDNCPLFEFGMNSEDFNSDKHPIFLGTKFQKEIVCPACGITKWHQLSDLRIDTSSIKKELIIKPMASNIYGSFILISDKMAQILKNVNVTGYKLRPVVHVGSEKGRREVYQFIITNTLPSLSNKMRFEPIPGEYCSNCGINGRFKWPLHYDSSTLDDLKDFNLTHEYIGNGGYCERLMVISARVRRLLLDLNLKRKAWMQPVILVDK